MNRGPLHYGFNLLWMYSAAGRGARGPADFGPDPAELDFIQAMGCNFVRLPLDYRFWVPDFDYSHPDKAMLERVEACVRAVTDRGLHCSLNIHRAPGYCINGAELERHRLFVDTVAQNAFTDMWTQFAHRFQDIGPELLSFDLLNEPPATGQYGMNRENHALLMRTVAAAIRRVSPFRPLTLDGLDGGNLAMPELADLGVTMSTRGYQPMPVTHYQASWCKETRGLGQPRWPGTLWAGEQWDADRLRAHYDPWRELEAMGVKVHIGEFGCYNRVDNSLALAWFKDILGIFHEFRWGYALWNLRGDFGIIGHQRPGTRWERRHGQMVDRDLYELYLAHMHFPA